MVTVEGMQARRGPPPNNEMGTMGTRRLLGGGGRRSPQGAQSSILAQGDRGSTPSHVRGIMQS